MAAGGGPPSVLNRRRCGSGAAGAPCTPAACPRCHSQWSSVWALTPSRAAMSSHAWTAPARISRSCGPIRSGRSASTCCASRRVVDEDAVAAQDVRNEVVGEDREAVEVAEAHDAGEREVRRHDLRPLVEAAIVEHRHPRGEVLGEALGRPVRLAHRLERPAPAEPPAELAQRLRVQRHELVVAGLPQRVGDLLRAHRAQLGGAPRPVGPEPLGHPRGHGEVAGHARPLADRRPPAGPEVDRVHADEERRDVAPLLPSR